LTTLPSPDTVFNHAVEKRAHVSTDLLSSGFAALSDPIRRDLLARLALGDATVGELAEPFDVSLQSISKHLQVLEAAGLISRSRDRQRRPAHLEAAAFEQLTSWIDRYRLDAEDRYRRLDDVLDAIHVQAPNGPDRRKP
jgi:DNA-binding transcriptional ArsR family regulator